jgi:eukaryotic-like serine/threonine-protein kinase
VPPPANAAPTPTQPGVTSPWAVVSAYYGDIESGNYPQAWSLLSPSMQASLGPYSSWVAGYQTTTQTNVTEVSQSGDTVTVSITAQQTDGSTKSYTGDYTVDNGQITSAHITQN